MPDKIAQIGRQAALAAGAVMRQNYQQPHQITMKGAIDPVTETDFQCQDIIIGMIRQAFPDKTILTATIAPVSVTAYPGGHVEPPAALRHRALVAFAGLARPAVFAATLQELGADLKGFQIFADHHPYSREELDRVTETARALGAGALVTTAKDWARLGERWDRGVLLWVLEVEAHLDDAGKVLELLDPRLQG